MVFVCVAAAQHMTRVEFYEGLCRVANLYAPPHDPSEPGIPLCTKLTRLLDLTIAGLRDPDRQTRVEDAASSDASSVTTAPDPLAISAFAEGGMS